MSVIEIDQDKCIQDGLCVADCPIAVLEIGPDDYPQPIAGGAADFCIDCGHCVAVCPTGALSQRSMDVQQCPEIDKSLKLTAKQAEQFLRSRRSIRQYKTDPVPKETLAKLIQIARYAPSGHNQQPVQWLVITDPNEVKHLAGLVVDWIRWMIENQPEIANTLHMDRVVAAWEAGQERVLRGAPHLIAAHAPKDERTAPSSCMLALSYLELAAPSLGLGTCLAGYFMAAAGMHAPLQEALKLPDGHIVFGAAMVGYPDVEYQRLPERKEPAITWR
jgi:nitroreductase/NAD-dependent dihydropyrimidine dehydrogenase PreA subunit